MQYSNACFQNCRFQYTRIQLSISKIETRTRIQGKWHLQFNARNQQVQTVREIPCNSVRQKSPKPTIPASLFIFETCTVFQHRTGCSAHRQGYIGSQSMSSQTGPGTDPPEDIVLLSRGNSFDRVMLRTHYFGRVCNAVHQYIFVVSSALFDTTNNRKIINFNGV